MSLALVRLAVRARALSTARSTAAIAAAEPGWFLLVTCALIGGSVVAAQRLEPQRQLIALGVVAVVLTLALSTARRDATLHRVLGVAPGMVRVVEALLWSSPLIGLAALLSVRGSAVMASAVVATAALSVGVRARSRSRAPRRVLLRLAASLPEWTVGLRQSAPVLVVALLAGLAGSGAPGIVILAMAVVSLVTSAFFWTPAEGWLLIHARDQTASRFLAGKLARSVGLLSVLLVPLVLLGLLREPSAWRAYLLALATGLHAHAAAVAVKYASYREGRSLDAAGSLLWTISALAIVVPPIGLLLLAWLYRRGVARIADYCPGSSHAR